MNIIERMQLLSFSYSGFLLVVSLQFIWFLVVSYIYCKRIQWKYLAVGILIGIPIGAFFDLAIGKFGNIFDYFGLEKSHFFMLINGMISYGISVATVMCVKTDNITSCKARPIIGLLIASTAISISQIPLFSGLSSIAAMFLYGAVLVLTIEALCVVFGFKGYTYLAIQGSPKPMLKISIFSALTGLIYELSNYAFPLWNWKNDYPSDFINVVLIITLGYYVLLLPLFTISNYLRKLVHQ
jgi:hypothetical protein